MTVQIFSHLPSPHLPLREKVSQLSKRVLCWSMYLSVLLVFYIIYITPELWKFLLKKDKKSSMFSPVKINYL